MFCDFLTFPAFSINIFYLSNRCNYFVTFWRKYCFSINVKFLDGGKIITKYFWHWYFFKNLHFAYSAIKIFILQTKIFKTSLQNLFFRKLYLFAIYFSFLIFNIRNIIICIFWLWKLREVILEAAHLSCCNKQISHFSAKSFLYSYRSRR